MKIIICIISALFGGLSLAAAVSQLKSEKSPSAAIMIIGSLLLIFAVILNIIGLKFDFIIAALGCLAICAAAIMNGKKSAQIHISHHIIRGVLSVALVAGHAIW